MSSNILSRPIDVSKFGLIYAGAQKNIGPAGLTVVIVREDLLGRARPETPSVFNYKAVADEGSLLNTPPTFAWYMAGLVFKWLKKNGGLAAMAERNRAKARALYAAIDGSSFYRNRVAKDARSWMNVTFTLAKPDLDAVFLEQAAAAGLEESQGPPGVGRDARKPLQCDAARRRRGARRLHARVRAQACVRDRMAKKNRAGAAGAASGLPHRAAHPG